MPKVSVEDGYRCQEFELDIKQGKTVPYFESTNLYLLGKCALWNFDGKCLPFTSIVELFYNYWKTLFVGLQEQTNPSKHLWI